MIEPKAKRNSSFIVVNSGIGLFSGNLSYRNALGIQFQRNVSKTASIETGFLFSQTTLFLKKNYKMEIFCSTCYFPDELFLNTSGYTSLNIPFYLNYALFPNEKIGGFVGINNQLNLYRFSRINGDFCFSRYYDIFGQDDFGLIPKCDLNFCIGLTKSFRNLSFGFAFIHNTKRLMRSSTIDEIYKADQGDFNYIITNLKPDYLRLIQFNLKFSVRG